MFILHSLVKESGAVVRGASALFKLSSMPNKPYAELYKGQSQRQV